MEKLVRDFIPEIIEQSGRTPIHYRATDEQYRKFLREKLKEEVQEFLDAESVEELADVLEVIEAIHEAYNFTKESVLSVKKDKRNARGGFGGRVVLKRIE